MFEQLGGWPTVIAVVLGIAAIVVPLALWIADRQRNRKRLGYYIESNTSLLNSTVRKLGTLELTHNGQAVTDPFLTVISFYNLGRLPITAADYEQPLTIELGDVSTLAAVTTKSSPPELKATGSVLNSTVTIEPMLMNGGDHFTLSIITDGKVKPRIKARVVDVTSLEELTLPDEWRRMNARVRILAIPLTATMLAVSMTAIIRDLPEQLIGPSVVAFGLLMALYFPYLLRYLLRSGRSTKKN